MERLDERRQWQEVYVHIMLKDAGFSTEQTYEDYIDTMYSKDPNNDLWRTLIFEKDAEGKVLHIRPDANLEWMDWEYAGKILMMRLKQECSTDANYESFVQKVRFMLKLLPDSIKNAKPFCYLCCACDSFNDGDEKHFKELCEKAFNFYSRE